MKKKSLPLPVCLAIISFSVALFFAAAIIALFFIFRFKAIVLALLLAAAGLAGAIFFIAGKMTIGKPLKNLDLECRALSLFERPKMSLSRLREVRIINRAVRDLWLQSQKITTCLFETIDSHSAGFFYHLKNEDKVYCNQKFREICDEAGPTGFIELPRFNRIYRKVTDLYYDSKYRAYLLEDFRWVRLYTHRQRNYFFGLLYDITEEVNKIREIEKERDIDSLTGLYNRFAFEQLARHILSDASIKAAAVIMWDIDKLKNINDTYGHDNGDRYLRKFAEILKSLEDYGGLISRRSGDEFLALIYGEERDQIQPLIDEINRAIDGSSILIDDSAVEKMRASCGVAWYPENGVTLGDLINYADNALYENKYRLSDETVKMIRVDISIENCRRTVKEIIEKKDIHFAFQPIVNAENARIFGYESFMRTYDNVVASSERFIELAREQAKLHLVEEMVFEKCLASAASYVNPKKRVFIHSFPNIILPDLTLEKLFSKMPDHKFVVEINDYHGADKEILISKIKSLKSYNFEICLDNIESAQIADDVAGLIDFIKPSMNIIRNININSINQAKLREILRLARKKNCKVIAPGIETYEEFKYLISKRVVYLQGYYFAGPIAVPLAKRHQISKNALDKMKAIINRKKNKRLAGKNN